MIDFDQVLETGKIRLRPMRKEDYESFLNLTQPGSMWTWFTSDLSLPGELRKWVDAAVSEMQEHKRLPFTVIELEHNRIVGSTSFGNISLRDRRIEIGWTWIARAFQGKGINDEMKYAMLKYCFEQLELERVEFKTDVLNIPARKALQRMGMIEEGILRSHTLMTHNRRRDTIFYSMLKTEWDAMREKNKGPLKYR